MVFTLVLFFSLGNLAIRTSGYDQGGFVTSAKA
jgi:hypothetical protein